MLNIHTTLFQPIYAEVNGCMLLICIQIQKRHKVFKILATAMSVKKPLMGLRVDHAFATSGTELDGCSTIPGKTVDSATCEAKKYLLIVVNSEQAYYSDVTLTS